jgi:hypothetical protein
VAVLGFWRMAVPHVANGNPPFIDHQEPVDVGCDGSGMTLRNRVPLPFAAVVSSKFYIIVINAAPLPGYLEISLRFQSFIKWQNYCNYTR